jgi:hypothetical protein
VINGTMAMVSFAGCAAEGNARDASSKPGIAKPRRRERRILNSPLVSPLWPRLNNRIFLFVREAPDGAVQYRVF